MCSPLVSVQGADGPCHIVTYLLLSALGLHDRLLQCGGSGADSRVAGWSRCPIHRADPADGCPRPKSRRTPYHHTKAFGDGLFELRLKGREGIARVFFCTLVGKRIVELNR